MPKDKPDLFESAELKQLGQIVIEAVRERLGRDDVGLVLIVTEYGENPAVHWVSTMDRETSLGLLRSIAKKEQKPTVH